MRSDADASEAGSGETSSAQLEVRAALASGLPTILIAALAQGWALYGLHHAVRHAHWPATDSAWLLALYAVAVFVPFTVEMLASWVRSRAMWLLVAAAALALFYFGWHAGAYIVGAPERFADGDDWLPNGFVLGVLWLILLPFVQLRLAEATWRPRYASLFAIAWRNKITLAEAGAFTGLFWLLLFLWQELFEMLGIRFFKELFEEPIFIYPVTALVFGGALHLIGSVERLTRVVLEQALSVLKWLALLAGLILALFTLALALKLPGMIASGERAISAAWLLWLTAVTVLLVNAAFRDGGVERPYPHAVAFALRCVVPLTVVISLTAVYALYVRIDAYGFTIERVWACIVAAAACLYSVGYALAARTRSPWMAGVARVNVATAWFLIAVVTLALTPVLSPQRIAASSQFQMALRDQDETRGSSQSASTPMEYLRFRSGEYGLKKLRELAALESHPRAAQLRKEAEALLARKNPWERTQQDVRERLASMPVHPETLELDARLRARIEGDLRGELRHLDAGALAGAFVDLDEDGVSEFVLLTAHLAIAYESASGDWRRIGLMHPVTPLAPQQLADALLSGEVRTAPPKWRQLIVGDSIFRLQ